MARTRVYIQPFLPNGTYSGTWIEVTRDAISSGLGSIQRKLDLSDYDIGIYTNSSISITLRNDQGLYSDVGNTNSIFSYKRADSLVKITWDQADYNFFAGISHIGEICGTETTIFVGMLSDEATQMQMSDQTITFDILGYEAIFDRVLAPNWVSSPPSDKKCSTLLKALVATANAGITQPVLTIDNTQIVPGNDISFDDLSVFANKTCKEVIDSVLEAANSILYIGGANLTTPVVAGRTPSASVLYTFRGPTSKLGPENIQDLQAITTGINRVFNFLTWTNGTITSQDTASTALYGVRKKDLSVDGVTTGATQQAILDAIRKEFAFPKQEFQLITPINTAVLTLPLLAQVLIDFPLIPIDATTGSLYGQAIYGQSVYGAALTSFQIQTSEPYKVIATQYDLVNGLVTLNLRRV